MRGAMSGRKSLIFALGLIPSLALLTWVLVVPIRSSGLVPVSVRPDCLRLDFALPLGQPTACLSIAMATEAVLQVDAFPSDDEEQDRAVAANEPRVSFLIPCSFRKISTRQLIPPRSIHSTYPLRS